MVFIFTSNLDVDVVVYHPSGSEMRGVDPSSGSGKRQVDPPSGSGGVNREVDPPSGSGGLFGNIGVKAEHVSERRQGSRQSTETICLVSAGIVENFSQLNARLVSSHRRKTFSRFLKHRSNESPKTKKSSMNTSMISFTKSSKMASIHRWKVAGALHNAKIEQNS
ncbi:hypothetical protein LINPERHAP2_LOCUS34464, partial [Linum perenne]